MEKTAILKGRIIKGIAGFFYVYTEKGIFECKARGLFRKEGKRLLVGDYVTISVTDFDEKKGNLEEADERKNELIRPACANVDIAVIVMAISKPKIKYQLLDKLIIFFEYYKLDVVLVFNKDDEGNDKDRDFITDRFKSTGYNIIFTSTVNGEGVDSLKAYITGNTSILTGPSGVGKSSLLNVLLSDNVSGVGEIGKTGRGKHTTRHSEIFPLAGGGFIFDTPGFTSLDLPDIKKEDLKFYYPEFRKYEGKCRFDGCMHINEPACAVKEAVFEGSLSEDRYKNYIEFFNKLSEKGFYRGK